VKQRETDRQRQRETQTKRETDRERESTAITSQTCQMIASKLKHRTR